MNTLNTLSTQSHFDLPDVRFASWLELALSAASSRWPELSTRVVVRLLDLQGSQAWWGVTLDERWLRGGNGAITIFDSLPAADRFLRLLKVKCFNIGKHCDADPCVEGQAQEVYTLGDRCNHCQRGACEAALGQHIFHCPQLSQRRLSASSTFMAHPPQHATARVGQAA